MGCGCGQKKIVSQTSVQMEQARQAELDRRIALERQQSSTARNGK